MLKKYLFKGSHNHFSVMCVPHTSFFTEYNKLMVPESKLEAQRSDFTAVFSEKQCSLPFDYMTS